MNDIMSGIALGPRVTAVVPQDDYKLLLTFTNGERRIFDAKSLLNLPVFKPLSNKSFIQSVTVSYGTVAWGQDIDYCPDTLYNESILEVEAPTLTI